MSLKTFGNGLLVGLAGFVVDCLCCGSCRDDSQCEEGYECLGGTCYDKCKMTPCSQDGDCAEGCVCYEGNCIPASDAYYCARAEGCTDQGNGVWHDANGDPGPCEPECRKGRPGEAELIQAGPFGNYGMCCFVGCGCRYSCNPVSLTCDPDLDGVFDSENDCNGGCGDPSDMGRCCQSVVCYDDKGDAISYTTGAADVCPSTREWCQNDPPVPPGQCRTFRSFNAALSTCTGCPVNAQGPCCLEDQGCVMDMDRIECERAGGTFKGNSWIDCETARDPDVGLLYKHACPNCNELLDCNCDFDEKCDGLKCVPCGDTVVLVEKLQPDKWTGVDVKKGDTVSIYHRNCVNGKPEIGLSANYKIADNEIGQVVDNIEFVSAHDGQIAVYDASESFNVCITVESPVVDCNVLWPPQIGDFDEEENFTDPNTGQVWSRRRFRRYEAPPAQFFTWNPGYPAALPEVWRWVWEQHYGSTLLGRSYGETFQRSWKLLACDNGVFTDLTAEAVTPARSPLNICPLQGDPAWQREVNVLSYGYCAFVPAGSSTCTVGTDEYEECWNPPLAPSPWGLYELYDWGNPLP